MKNIVNGLLILLLVSSCDNEINKSFTGNQLNYTLFSGSDFGYEGTINIKEKLDGAAQLVITLTGPDSKSFFPAHLHFNSFDIPDAELAAILTPVSGQSGQSITDIDFLSDDRKVTFKDFESFNGHIKIHLDDGANENVILAFGNIGANKLKLDGEAAQCNGSY